MAAVAQNSKSCASHRRPTPCISALYGESRIAKRTLESGGSAPPLDLALQVVMPASHKTGGLLLASLQRKVERRIVMKTWKCGECQLAISELGSYVKGKSYWHLHCYSKLVVMECRKQFGQEALQATADDAERQKEAAIAAWRAATRCPKCGVPMLSERPAGLPDAFSTVLCSNGSTCTLCVRQEAGLRAAARGREAPPPAAALRSATMPDYEGAMKLARENEPKMVTEDTELMRKAKEAGTPAIEIE